MKEKYFALVRMGALVVASLGMIIVVAGVLSELTSHKISAMTVSNEPAVEFSNFKEFKNSVPEEETKVDTDTLNKEKEIFQAAFFKSSQEVYSNLSKYALSLEQSTINQDRFDEYLFDLVFKYEHDLRLVYLEQLSQASSELLSYAEDVKSNNAKVIDWNEFLDWFSYDFDDQLQAKEMKNVNEDTTNMFLNRDTLILFVLLLIVILQLRIEENTSIKIDGVKAEEVSTDEESEIQVDETQESKVTQ